MILVTIRLIGPLTVKMGFSEKQLEVSDKTTVGALVLSLGIDPSFPTIVVRNGLAVSFEDILNHGDRIAISPIYSGG